MDHSASAATKDAERIRRRRSCTLPRFSSTPPGASERSVLRASRMNGQSSNLAVPLVAPKRNYYAASVPPAAAIYQLAKGPTLRAIMLKISGEPQLLLVFVSALLSLAFLLTSWSGSS